MDPFFDAKKLGSFLARVHNVQLSSPLHSLTSSAYFTCSLPRACSPPAVHVHLPVSRSPIALVEDPFTVFDPHIRFRAVSSPTTTTNMKG